MMSDDLDLTTRQLCPDGACIGVIGPNGRCKVCGRAGDPSLRTTATTSEPDPDAADAETDSESGWEAETDSELDADAASFTEAFSDDEPRELCIDGACIGVLGPDRRCKVCGRFAGS